MQKNMSSRLPFELGLSGGTDVRPELCPICIHAQTDESAAEVADLLDALCTLTHFGCFNVASGAKILPGAKIERGRWVGELSVRGVHPAFWRVFLQMCSQYHRLVSPINRVELDIHQMAPLDASYPTAPPSIPFHVERAAIRPNTPAVIRLDAVSWPTDALDNIRGAFEDWGSVVFSGGFFPADQEMDEPPFDTLSVNLLGRTRLECVAVGWRSIDAAVDCALALCLGMHNFIQPLLRVEIE